MSAATFWIIQLLLFGAAAVAIGMLIYCHHRITRRHRGVTPEQYAAGLAAMAEYVECSKEQARSQRGKSRSAE